MRFNLRLLRLFFGGIVYDLKVERFVRSGSVVAERDAIGWYLLLVACEFLRIWSGVCVDD